MSKVTCRNFYQQIMFDDISNVKQTIKNVSYYSIWYHTFLQKKRERTGKKNYHDFAWQRIRGDNSSVWVSYGYLQIHITCMNMAHTENQQWKRNERKTKFKTEFSSFNFISVFEVLSAFSLYFSMFVLFFVFVLDNQTATQKKKQKKQI